MRYHHIDRRAFLRATAAIAIAVGAKMIPDLKIALPYSLVAEQSVLGGLLIDNCALEKIAGLLSGGEFYLANHRKIYRHIVALIQAKLPADALTVAASLRQGGKLENVGGLDYIASLAFNTPSAKSIRRWAEMISRDDAARQRPSLSAYHCPIDS